MKKINQTTKIIIIVILLVLVLFRKVLSTEVMNVLSYTFAGLFIVTIFLFKKNYHKIKSYFPKVKRKTILFLVLIILFAVCSRIILTHMHTFLPDDFWHMEQTKNLILTGENQNCVYNPELQPECFVFKSVGLSTIQSIPMLIFGFNNYALMNFNSLLSVINIVLIFLVVLLLFRSEKAALWSSFILTLSSKYLIASNHIEDVVLGITFFLLMIIFYYIYHKHSEQSFLAAVFFSLMVLTRFEYALFFIIPIWIYGKKFFEEKNERLIVVVSVVFLLILAYLIMLQSQVVQTSTIHITEEINPYSQNKYFSLEEIVNNTGELTFIFSKKIFFLFITISLGGLFFAFKKNKTSLLFIISTIIPLYLYLSVTSPHFKETIIVVMIVMLIYTGLMLEYISKRFDNKKIIYVIIILLIVLSLNQTLNKRHEFKSSKLMQLDTKAFVWLNQQEISDECFIITERPSYTSGLTKLKGIRTIDILQKEDLITKYLSEGKCLLFYENSFCYQMRDSGPAREPILDNFLNSPARCMSIKNNYDLTIVSELEYQDLVYRLYKLKN